MKKFLPIMVIGILVLSGLGAVVSSTEDELESEKVSIVFSRPIIREENEYTTIEIKETNGFLMEQNKPMLPSYTHTFVYPAGTEIINVKCTAKNIQQIQISKQIEPTPVAIPVSALTKTVAEEATYTLTEPYPETWYEYDVGSGIVDDERSIILKVQILPVKYNPIESYVEWAEEVEIEIEYETNTEPINYDDEYNLLILTPGKYSSQIQPLVNHKNNRGISTKAVTLGEISGGTYFPAQGRDDIEEIKYFIKNALDNWLITNVLIVGGASDFPARETHVLIGEDDDEIFVSDLYYADIYDGEGFSSWDTNGNSIFAEYKWDGETDEIDFYPDVKIGRLACINTQQVTTIVNKIIKYENDKAYTQNWFNNIVVIGGDTVPESYGDNSDTDEGERVNQFILDRMQGFIPDKIWDSNGRLSGLIPSGLDNIKSGIENGCGFLDFSGHGAPWIWTTFPHNGDRQTLPTPTGRYTNTIIGQLNNGDMLPIVVNGGCSLGKYTHNDNCNAWAFLANPNGGGIASFGATGLGYVYIGEYVTEGLVEGLNIDIFEAYRDGAITFGEMYVDGLNIYLGPGMDGGDYKTLMEWHAFGDPTLAIGEDSTPPEKPSRPNGPTSGNTGESHEYTSTSTDLDGDEIYYLFDWGDDTYSWVGPYASGQEASASNIWNSQGDFQIRVKAKDDHGKMSPWSDPLSVSMPRSKHAYNPLFTQILERLADIFPILWNLLQL